MRSPKWLVVSTAIVSSICLILILCSQSDSLLFSIALAIFGSSILGLNMSLIQYYSTKRECLERFYLTALCILKELTRIRPYEDEWENDDFDHVCKTFVEVSNAPIDDLGNAYGTLDFFVNKNLRNKICYAIYVEFNKYIKDLFHKSYNFSSYLDGKLDISIARIRYTRFSDEWFYKRTEMKLRMGIFLI